MRNYLHVSCDLHEHLKAIADSAEECGLTYINKEGKLIRSLGKIIKIYSEKGQDWCQLSNGSIIRFDRIETIEHRLKYNNTDKHDPMLN
ncbi:MAG: hypothetical protein QNJ60_21350 [Xenococcaceae cyanobacterium MO_188.B19]|nr:hypothetical protein [Xenococcaceae cyanobacterium MO_188.B19]